MKKVFSILIIISLILGGLGAVASPGDEPYIEKTKIESMLLSKPIIASIGEFISVDFDEATSFMLEPGKPMLPVFTKVFVLPFGSKIVDVDVSFSNENTMIVSNLVKPAPEPVPLNSINQISMGDYIDESIYESSEVFPSERYSFSTGGGLHSNEHVTFLSVKCYPVRYSPASNMLHYSKEIDIEVVYDEPPSHANSLDQYDLVIIAPSKFTRSLQQLVDHKEQYNIRTIVKTTQEIYSEFSGYDNAEKIKYFLKYAIESWDVKYALLVGGMDLLPMRISGIQVWNSEGIPTDLYYADIYDSEGQFCSWDSNQNGIFGEYNWRDGPIDDVDLFADINIGRLPCRNKIDVLITVNKIIDYETQSYGEPWCNKIILMGGDTFPNHGVVEGEVVTEKISQQMSSFESVKLWTSTGNYGPLKINSAITSGACFVSYSGHGYEFGFGTSPPNVDERIEYYTPYTLGMLNSKKYPVIFFDACSTSKLDYTIGGIKIPCFAWYLVKKPVGGAVATIGATRVAYTHVDHQGVHGGAGLLNVNFFKAYEPGIAVSEMLVSTQNDYINQVGLDCLTLEEFTLIGDPSLKIGGYVSTNQPKVEINDASAEINGCPNIPVQLTVTVTNINQPYTISWDLDGDNSYDDATGESIDWIWDSIGAYQIGIKVFDETYSTMVNIQSKPNSLIGPGSARTLDDVIYLTQPVNNPSWNEIYYLVDWGDGTFSDIIGPVLPSEALEIPHSWERSGNYQIRIKTMLTNDYSSEESGWSDSIPVTISKNRILEINQFSLFLEKLIQHFPRVVQFLQQFFGL